MKIHVINYKGQPRHRLVGYLQGKEIRRWFRTQKAAERFWAKSQREAARGASAVISMSDTDRALAVTAIERARAGGYDLLAALQYYEAHLDARQSQTITVTKAVKLFLVEKELRGLRDRSVKSLRNVCEDFAKTCGNRTVTAVSRADIEQYLDSGWAAQTKNGYLTRIHTLFAWCIKAGYASSNPVANVERFRVERGAPAVLSPADAQTLLDTCRAVDGKLLPYFALGLFCGIRPHELTGIKWGDVDLKEKHVEVGASVSKTRERRIVTIPDNCVAWLDLGGDLGELLNLRKRVDAVWAASGVERSADVMRHSFASYHLAKHTDAPKTAHELGHRGDTTMLFTHYRNVVKPADATAYFEIHPKP